MSTSRRGNGVYWVVLSCLRTTTVQFVVQYVIHFLLHCIVRVTVVLCEVAGPASGKIIEACTQVCCISGRIFFLKFCFQLCFKQPVEQISQPGIVALIISAEREYVVYKE